MFDDPSAVVRSFISAMRAWEIQARAEQRRAHASGAGVGHYGRDDLAIVFREHCTPRDRPQGRLAAPFFQQPPEYDPQKELVVAVEAGVERATVETERAAVLGGGRYQYRLHKVTGRWWIDSVRYLLEGAWVRHTL